jgi:SAM-dependent methyltransferase
MYGRCELIHREHDERRIELSWRSGRNHTGALARVLVPDRSDFDAVALGEAWWFGYVGVHLLRLPKRLWVRRSETARLGHFFVTPSSLVEPLLRFADAGPDELVVDLGCGDGRILVGAAQIGCRARGIESNPTLVDLARAAVSAAGVEDRVDVVHGDATNANLDDADVVVMFFPVGTLRELIPNVLSRLRPGARLIVHEQQRLLTTVSPDRSAPIASPAGVTVAHRWVR